MQTQTQTDSLVRKQFFVSADNITKLERLVKLKGISAAKIVRDAIDAYSPNGNQASLEETDLLELAHARVREAIVATDKANHTLDACLNTLSKKENC